MTLRRLLLVALLAIASGGLAGHAHAAGPAMTLGVAEDAVRAPDLPTAEAKMAQLRLAGFTAVRVTTNWAPGLTAPDADELRELRNVETAADLNGVEVYVSVYNVGQRTTPLDPIAQSQFAQYAASVARLLPTFDQIIVGNEPNLNRFWLPQFGPGGENVSAAAYLRLLAATHDAVKATADDVRVWGGATAPRGADRPGAGRETTSPTTFIRALGAAYRRSGRDRPVMDGFVHHPYPESSAVPIDLPHPRVRSIGVADYDKLVRLLGDAFDGTAQKGSDLPILYGEIGVETTIPAAKQALYTDREIARTISERAQSAAYRRVLELASCQPNVAGVLFFHLLDEPSLVGWQSGVRYVDGSPKTSLAAVHAAAGDAAAGRLDVHCGS